MDVFQQERERLLGWVGWSGPSVRRHTPRSPNDVQFEEFGVILSREFSRMADGVPLFRFGTEVYRLVRSVSSLALLSLHLNLIQLCN